MRGFTLVEVLIAVSLLAVVCMFMLGIFPTASVAMHRADQEETAGALAIGHHRFDGISCKTIQTVAKYPTLRRLLTK